MTGASLALQRAVHAALTGSHDVMAAVTGVFDAVPSGARPPYATIGADAVSDWSAVGVDGREHRFAVTVWDDAAGSSRLKAAMAAVEAAVLGLDADLDGWRVVGLVFVTSAVTRDADGPARGEVEFRARTVAD